MVSRCSHPPRSTCGVPVRRSLTVLCAASLALSGLAASWTAPATAAPADQANTRAAEAVPDELLVGYVRGASSADRERARGRASAQRVEQVVAAGSDRTEVELVRIPSGANREQAIAELQSDPAVAYAEPNWIYRHQVTATDPYFTNGSLWGMYGDAAGPPDLQLNEFGSQAAEAWAADKTGSKQVYIGVIDEGIQFDHPDLAGQVGNPNELPDEVDNDGNGYIDDVYGWDFDGNNNTIYDGGTKGNLDDHGTHVSGTIGAKANGAGVVGVNHAVTLISGKFLGRRGGSLANAVKAVDYFTDLKTKREVNIVATSNSWGGGGFSKALLDAIVRGAKADILFVAAAGNSGTDNDTTDSYPSNYDTTAGAGYDAVIAVAAIDSAGGLASFSQYGAQTVDLGAPGVGVWSTTAYSGYSSYSGTSMATPHVSGAAALIAASVQNSDASSLSAAQIKQRLLTTAVMTPSLCGKSVTNGRLDVAAAIAGTPATLACANPPSGGSGSSTEPSVTVTAGTKSGNFTPVIVTWKNFTGSNVDVTRSGSTFSTPNDEELTETWRGTGIVTYTICETGSNPRCAEGSTKI